MLRRLSSEIGAVRKDHGGRLRVCLVYPNTYRVGMSSLGFQAIYHLFNSHGQVADPPYSGDVVCERAFIPDPADLAELIRTDSPLVSYESQTPVHDFDVLAFSVSYELDYVNIARVLRLGRIPARVRARGEHHPLVIAGGAAVSINPEPLADLLDLGVIGEGEPVCGDLLDLLGSRQGTRAELLAGAARLPGVWVPSLPGKRLARQHVRDLGAWPTHSRLLTHETEFGELFLVEASRGCGRGCKFCVTPACYWPLRWRPAASILDSVRLGLQYRKAIGLVGAAVSDHPQVEEIVSRIAGLGARVSVSSLRADSVSPGLIEALAASGTRSITLAPEAGSDRLRAAIGKPISEEQVIGALQMATAGGIREAKLYFMVGLPGEREEDISAIPVLVRRCSKAAGLGRLTVAAAGFVPKPHTPYEREAMLPAPELSRRLRAIREELRGERGVSLALESASWSYLEGALSRGDRRLGEVIIAAEAKGGNLAAWRRAFQAAGLTPEQFAGPRHEQDELPWAFIAPGRGDR